jgi:hypothetical protein
VSQLATGLKFLAIFVDKCIEVMTSKAHLLEKQVSCSICGKDLDPSKPLESDPGEEDSSRLDGFSCIDCWLRELRSKTAEPLLARTLDRVLLE